MTVIRFRKADARSGTGSFHERVLRRRFKQLEPKPVRMCRGCSKPKAQCDCPKSCFEASQRYNALLAQLKKDLNQLMRAERIARKRSKIKIVP